MLSNEKSVYLEYKFKNLLILVYLRGIYRTFMVYIIKETILRGLTITKFYYNRTNDSGMLEDKHMQINFNLYRFHLIPI